MSINVSQGTSTSFNEFNPMINTVIGTSKSVENVDTFVRTTVPASLSPEVKQNVDDILRL